MYRLEVVDKQIVMVPDEEAGVPYDKAVSLAFTLQKQIVDSDIELDLSPKPVISMWS